MKDVELYVRYTAMIVALIVAVWLEGSVAKRRTLSVHTYTRRLPRGVVVVGRVWGRVMALFVEGPHTATSTQRRYTKVCAFRKLGRTPRQRPAFTPGQRTASRWLVPSAWAGKIIFQAEG